METKREKNRESFIKEIKTDQTCLVEKMLEQQTIITWDDVENSHYTDEQIKRNFINTTDKNEEEIASEIQQLRDEGEDYKEIGEWYTISDYAASMFRKIDAVIIECSDCGCYWWGREDTSIPLKRDLDIEAILDILERM